MEDLEAKLEKTFAKISRFADSTRLRNVDKIIRKGCHEYVDGNYAVASGLFSNALRRKFLDNETTELILGMRAECDEQLFTKNPTQETFANVCRGYESMLDLRESADVYQNYIKFLTQTALTKNLELHRTALNIVERGAAMFPLDPELNAELAITYRVIGENEKAYDAMLHTCKLVPDNPDFLYAKFSGKLFEPKPGTADIGTAPVNVLMNYKKQDMLKNTRLMHAYGKLMVNMASGLEHITYVLLIKAYEKNKQLPGIKEDVFKAYNNLVLSIKNKHVLDRVNNHFYDFAMEHGFNNDPKWKKIWGKKPDDKEYQYVDEDPIEGNTVEKALIKHSSPPSAKTILRKSPENAKKSLEKKIELLSPRQIKKKLDEYIVGQESAKKALAVAASNHLLRVSGRTEKLKKNNVLLLGPTGCGKSFSARVLAMSLGLPFAMSDATKMTAAGYSGEDVDTCLHMLLLESQSRLELAEKGVIFIDEGDKIKAVPDSGRDVGGEGVQQQLLKLMEGSNVKVPLSRQKYVMMNTENIMFIVSGAFSYSTSGESIKQKKQSPKIKGFRSCVEELEGNVLRTLTDKDLADYGFIPEFAGRLQTRVVLDELDKSQLKEILVKPKEALIPQYQELFSCWGIELKVEDSAMDKIAEEAMKLKAGARSLSTICESIFGDYSYELLGSSKKELVVGFKEVEEALERARS